MVSPSSGSPTTHPAPHRKGASANRRSEKRLPVLLPQHPDTAERREGTGGGGLSAGPRCRYHRRHPGVAAVAKAGATAGLSRLGPRAGVAGGRCGGCRGPECALGWRIRRRKRPSGPYRAYSCAAGRTAGGRPGTCEAGCCHPDDGNGVGPHHLPSRRLRWPGSAEYPTATGPLYLLGWQDAPANSGHMCRWPTNPAWADGGQRIWRPWVCGSARRCS